MLLLYNLLTFAQRLPVRRSGPSHYQLLYNTYMAIYTYHYAIASSVSCTSGQYNMYKLHPYHTDVIIAHLLNDTCRTATEYYNRTRIISDSCQFSFFLPSLHPGAHYCIIISHGHVIVIGNNFHLTIIIISRLWVETQINVKKSKHKLLFIKRVIIVAGTSITYSIIMLEQSLPYSLNITRPHRDVLMW